MQYGTGDGVSTGPFTALDIEGHEFTHMVINYNGNGGLNYQSESGALNESFADISVLVLNFTAE
jgi:bacillolysin